MSRPRALAAAQTTPRRGDVEANVAQHLALARLAAAEGARALVFPELSLTGYELDLARGLAFAEDDARLAPLLEAARELDLVLVAGAPARADGKLHIGAFVLAPDRSVALYTKQHLGAFDPDADLGGPTPPPEAAVFEPGDRDPPVVFDGHPAAVAICADTGHPSHPANAARRGATTYLAGVFVTPAGLAEETGRLARYAELHALAVAMANYGGPTAGLAAGGGSAVWSPSGELLARLDPEGAGVVVAIGESAGWRARAVRAR